MAKKAAYAGCWLAVALLFSYVEALFPLPIPLPGVKLGLANLMVLLLLYRRGAPAAGLLNLARILLAALLFGGVSGLAFSLCGGGCSLLVMGFAKRLPWLSEVGVSLLGGAAHMLGQWLAAAVLLGVAGVLWYLPFLLAAGAVTGALLGVLARILLARLPKEF